MEAKTKHQEKNRYSPEELQEFKALILEKIAKAEKDLEYQQRFLASVRAKLANEKFVAHAPEAVIANERKKEADALSRIESLEKQLKALKG